MRKRIAQEKAIENTLHFLKKLKTICNLTKADYQTKYSLGDLHKEFNVSKSTGTACRRLQIIKHTSDGYEWLVDKEPNREMALEVLEVLRQQSDRKKYTEIPDISTPLNEFVEKLKDISNHNETVLNRLKSTPMLSKALNQSSPDLNLFSGVDRKENMRFELMKEIAGNLYANRLLTDMDEAVLKELHKWAIWAATDLLNQFNAK